MSVTPLTPAQVAALRRASELAAELADLAGAVRAALCEDRARQRNDTEDTRLAAGELSTAFAAASGHARRRRRPRELFGR